MSSAVSQLREPLVSGDKTHGDVTSDIARHVGSKPTGAWWALLLVSLALFGGGALAMVQTVTTGIGTWGLNRTVGWGFDITNFVFWIGIGHAGTLISAVLFLFRQRWRTSINRAAEAMTIFAVMCAAIYPLIHMGRPWYFYWILPYPNNRGTLWVNFRSPLLWDFFAISTYFIISLTFWYIGMIPDLATLRDRAADALQREPNNLKHRIARAVFGFLSHGWNGSALVWHRYETIYALLALLATPLVVSVHSIVSSDFATSVIPGWHATLFPPYFVTGAIFGGFAMVLGLMLITRRVMRLEAYITAHHLNWMCKILLLASVVMGACYGIEFFCAWYSGSSYELYAFTNRAFGPYGWAYWLMVLCNVVVPQILWFGKARREPLLMGLVCVSVTIGMWFERFVIIVTSLHRDFLPSSWTMYLPTLNEAMIMAGMFGLFFSLFLLFTRALPIIAIAEIKSVLGYARPSSSEHGQAHDEAQASRPRSGAAQASRMHPDVAQASHPKPNVAQASRLHHNAPFGALLGAIRRRRHNRPTAPSRYCVAYFTDEHALTNAARAARHGGLRILDAFTPFPVHGLPQAMGLGPSRLAWIGAWAGALGLVAGLTLQIWTSAYDWPVRVGGQPFNSWPIFLPVTFELTVLFAGLIGVGALFARAGMWPGNRAPRLPGVTDNRFALAVALPDASAGEDAVARALTEAGATEIVTGDRLR